MSVIKYLPSYWHTILVLLGFIAAVLVELEVHATWATAIIGIATVASVFFKNNEPFPPLASPPTEK